ncbi:thioredoxin family protein [Desulfobotulus sp. H1]|uniref:Thioredoxin family protein n=1 Tax=Desulfobotulus pelophilus TaxID=2823377 RepID=A0ABT3NCW4_9BACT|nr:thioredoxin family protein [Desulfobotulus pelophilus]MCW7755309.1 thioredoxin family protein [Desulfobotulus pelophilus]
MKESLQARMRSAGSEFRLRLVGNYARNDSLKAFVVSLSESLEGVMLDHGPEEDKDCAGFILEERGLSFRGIPAHGDLVFFKNFLVQILENNDLPAEELKDSVVLRLFVSSHCPHCPAMLRMVSAFVKNDLISLEVVNVDDCPDMAQQWQVMAVPTLMVVGEEQSLRWTGMIRAADLEQSLYNRSTGFLDLQTLQNILESGDAQRLVSLMREKQCIPPAFYDLLTHEKWTIRLGAMVASESLILTEPALGEVLLEALWVKRNALEPVVFGDMVYLMGFGRREVWEPRLQSLLSQEDAGLKEAVEDALENLLKEGC